jgi:hypothetical protein|tara:strand:+ start:1319 stop:1429 length:111 start_codon:yes stop_codon:yes gene_type:complete
MKIKVRLSNAGEYKDLELIDAPKYIDIDVEVIEEDV